ncbi:MAG: polyamine aminopropyltransferase [Candidatus Sumerlaeota bacterium]
MQENWVSEKFYPDYETRYRVRQVLYSEKTDFQDMQLVETERFGKMLLLDGIVQTTEADEFIYHEMMAHVPLCIHPHPERVLIIGGGDGGILREVLRHPSVQKATMVEIDQKVIDFSKKHLPEISDGAFDSEKAEIVIDDGAQFVEQTSEQFDVAIVDSPDPVGPARVLFSQKFYGNIHRILTDEGLMSRQTGSTFTQAEEQRECMAQMRDIFAHNALYTFAVPTYVGGLFSAMLSSRVIDPLAVSLEKLQTRAATIQGPLRYYNPGVHFGAFQIPEYVKGNL